MRVRFIPFAVIVLVLVSACDGSGSGGSGSGAPSPVPTAPMNTPRSGSLSGSVSVSHPGPPHATAPTVPPDVPTTGPNLVRQGEQPPVMPLEATQHTQAGAVSFAKFFELTIDWGYATTSAAYMKHYFQPTCVTCKSIQAALDGAAAKRRHFIGDRLSVTAVTQAQLDTQHGAECSVIVSFTVSSAEVVDSSGTFINGQPALKMRDRVWMAWRGIGWTVVQLGPLA